MFNPSMFANMSPDQVKSQTEMFNNMSDSELEKHLNSAKSFMPGMPKMTPQMMRMASQ